MSTNSAGSYQLSRIQSSTKKSTIRGTIFKTQTSVATGTWPLYLVNTLHKKAGEKQLNKIVNDPNFYSNQLQHKYNNISGGTVDEQLQSVQDNLSKIMNLKGSEDQIFLLNKSNKEDYFKTIEHINNLKKMRSVANDDQAFEQLQQGDAKDSVKFARNYVGLYTQQAQQSDDALKNIDIDSLTDKEIVSKFFSAGLDKQIQSTYGGSIISGVSKKMYDDSNKLTEFGKDILKQLNISEDEFAKTFSKQSDLFEKAVSYFKNNGKNVKQEEELQGKIIQRGILTKQTEDYVVSQFKAIKKSKGWKTAKGVALGASIIGAFTMANLYGSLHTVYNAGKQNGSDYRKTLIGSRIADVYLL